MPIKIFNVPTGNDIEIFKGLIDGQRDVILLNVGGNALNNIRVESAPDIAGPYSLLVNLGNVSPNGNIVRQNVGGINFRVLVDTTGNTKVLILISDE